MTIGAGLLLIAVGAILRFGISTVSTHGFGIHTIGDILMAVGALGVVLWLIVWAPWGTHSRTRRTVYRDEIPPDRTVYRDEVPPDEVRPVARRYPADRYPADRPYYEDDYRR
jgi:multisubunit Na+/H+ antiporter MnhG subunit